MYPGQHLGGIVVRILHHVCQVHDVFIFVAMRLFGEKAAWVHQAHYPEQLNLSYMMHCKCDWTDTGAKQGFSQHTAEVSTDATDMSEHDMSVA